MMYPVCKVYDDLHGTGMIRYDWCADDGMVYDEDGHRCEWGRFSCIEAVCNFVLKTWYNPFYPDDIEFLTEKER